jgi:hypothetical protein
MESFINESSFYCFLGPTAHHISINNSIYSWQVGKNKVKNSFGTNKKLDDNDLFYLEKILPASFYYLSEENCIFLKKYFKINRSKNVNAIVDIRDLSLSGVSMKNVRYSINKCSKNSFEILDNYKNISDVEKMIEEWSNLYTEKYFRDFSGKNFYFLKNNYHKSCNNVFIYHGDDLVSFGVMSLPINGVSTYIIGKALYKRFYGLSEYTDMKLYEQSNKLGTEFVNMGQSNGKLHFYKFKFKNVSEYIDYSGKIEMI